MTTSDDSALPVLQALLRLCRDSAEGYATALHDVTDQELATELERFRTQRAKMADELSERVRELRGNADAGSTIAGAAHRAWIDVKSDEAVNPTQAILSEIERGEDVAVDAYRQALKEEDMDPLSHGLIEKQYELVQTAHDRIRQLRDRTNYART